MNVLQPWVTKLTLMQQSVLLCAIRGPDGFAKHHVCKPLLRWYRRCVLISAFDKIAITNPYQKGGGSFTGPSCEDSLLRKDCWWETSMKEVVDDFIGSRDEYHLHFYMHFIHASEIIGYKHPDERIRQFWNKLYIRMIHSLHMLPETEEMMDKRLSDTEDGWLARSDTSETEKYKESKL